MHEFRIFDSREAASIALADHISEALKEAIAKRGSASCVVSGGTSPVMMFRALRQHTLPWEKVTLVPSDERLVATDHEASNERMIRRELMREAAAAAQLISIGGAGVPDNAWLARINRQLGELSKPLDIVVLGMGDDGHTASLFADSPDIGDAMSSSSCCVVQQPPGFAVPRLTLTPSILLDATKIVLLFFGTHKRAVYDRAVKGDNNEQLPVRFVLGQQNTPILTFWAC